MAQLYCPNCGPVRASIIRTGEGVRWDSLPPGPVPRSRCGNCGSQLYVGIPRVRHFMLREWLIKLMLYCCVSAPLWIALSATLLLITHETIGIDPESAGRVAFASLAIGATAYVLMWSLSMCAVKFSLSEPVLFLATVASQALAAWFALMVQFRGVGIEIPATYAAIASILYSAPLNTVALTCRQWLRNAGVVS